MFRIYSKAGVDFGLWDGDTPEEALRDMFDVGGCGDDIDVDDWDFVPE